MKNAKISWIAVFIALTVVGASIKIPAIIGSVALDSFPALVAAALLGGVPGATVGGMGHLASSLIGGMPLGPLHILVAAEMAILAWFFAYFYRLGKKWLASISFIFGNAFVAPLPFIFILSKEFYFSMLASLLIASSLNTLLALMVTPRLAILLKPSFMEKYEK